MPTSPARPQLAIVRCMLKEPCDLAGMRGAQAAAKKVAHHVQCCVGEGVRTAKRLISQTFSYPRLQPFQEAIQTRDANALSGLVPETVVKIDRDGNVGI